MIYDPTTWPACGFIAFVSFYALAGCALAVWERRVDRQAGQSRREP